MTVNNDESDNSGGAGGSKKEVVLLLVVEQHLVFLPGKSWISSSSPNHNYYLQLLTDHLLNQLEQRL